MTLYLIGLGLNEKSISLEGLEACKNCEKIYLENYTVDFPYKLTALESVIGKKIESLNREAVEGEKFIEDAKTDNIALLVYGDVLAATTHVSLILAAEKQKIDYKIIHASSILTGIADTGLQLYKFGKTASMPKWSDNHRPDSFVEILRENHMIGAHSLILCDIGLRLDEAIEQLQETSDKFHLDQIVVCSNIGTEKQKIIYGHVDQVKKKKIENPLCLIIPGKMHFLEEEALERFGI